MPSWFSSWKRRRLYVALYRKDRGITNRSNLPADRYHWAVIVGPKSDKDNPWGSEGRVFHVKQGLAEDHMPGWVYEEEEIMPNDERKPLVRILVGKIWRVKKVEDILRGIPIRRDTLSWTCQSWVVEAIEQIDKSHFTMGSSVLGWADIVKAALLYVNHKTEQRRYDGERPSDRTPTATYDLLQDIEVIY